MTDWYAPNQQAVRADGSGPAEEGTGGASDPPKSASKAKAPAKTAGKADTETVDEEN